jgi:hypothetical protein
MGFFLSKFLPVLFFPFAALAEKVVADLWRLRRIPEQEAALHRRGYKMDQMEESSETDPSIIATRSLGRYAETFANLWRHEAALSRSSSRILHELQRLQAIRAGERVPAPAAVDVDVRISGNGRSTRSDFTKQTHLTTRYAAREAIAQKRNGDGARQA